MVLAGAITGRAATVSFGSLTSANAGTVIPGATAGVILLSTSGLRTAISGGATVAGSTVAAAGSYTLSSVPAGASVTVTCANNQSILLSDGKSPRHTLSVNVADVIFEYPSAHTVVAGQVEHFGVRLQVDTAANVPAGTYSTANGGGRPVQLKVASPNTSNTYSVNVSATVQASPTPITLTKLQDLAFSTVVPGASTGTVSVPVSGSATASGAPGPVLAPGNQAVPARFTVGGLAGAKYSVTLPSLPVTLSGALTVDTFTSSPATTGGLLGGTGTQDLYVGAVLHVPGNQAPGAYSGSFNVTVTYE